MWIDSNKWGESKYIEKVKTNVDIKQESFTKISLFDLMPCFALLMVPLPSPLPHHKGEIKYIEIVKINIDLKQDSFSKTSSFNLMPCFPCFYGHAFFLEKTKKNQRYSC